MLARVLRRRADRKATLAARLIQWTWRRRHRLPLHGVRWPMLRPVPRCLYGTNLATDSEFETQHARAWQVINHYKIYFQVFERIEKEPLAIGDVACSEGGQSYGIREMGGLPRGLDIEDQPRWRAEFGDESFVLGSALKESDIRALGRCHGFVASPPCQGGSSMPHAGGGLTESKEPMIVDGVRRLLEQTGKPFIIENVMGTYAQGHMRKDVCLRNHDMGLRAARPRVFEANFPLQKEAALDARHITRRCCLGGTSRMPRLDFLGRKWKTACCGANHYGVYSTPCNGVTKQMWEEAMGVPAEKMSVRGLALAIPPMFTAYLVGQMAAHICNQRYGMPIYSLEEVEATPSKAAELHRWIQGAGEEDAIAGQGYVAPAPVEDTGSPHGSEDRPLAGDRTLEEALSERATESSSDAEGDEASDAGTDEEASAATRPAKLTAAARAKGKAQAAERVLVRPAHPELARLHYEEGGQIDLVCGGSSVGQHAIRVVGRPEVSVSALHPRQLHRRHTLVVGAGREVRKVLHRYLTGGAAGKYGSALTAVVREECSQTIAALTAAGGRQVGSTPDARDDTLLLVYRVGEAGYQIPAKTRLTPSQQEALLDDTDVGCQPDPEAKSRLRVQPISRLWEKWQELGYAPHLVDRMRRGCLAPVPDEPAQPIDFGRYPEKEPGDDWHIASEMTRCITKGAMRWAEEGEEVTLIHPWVVVHQGEKIRPCQDLSRGLNELSPTPPGLPSTCHAQRTSGGG